MDEELEDILDDNEEDDEGFEGFDTEEIDEDDDEDEGVNTIAPKFDTDAMNTVLDSVGRIVLGNEEEALRFWIKKCLLTERYKYMAYDTDFGVEAEEIIRSNFDRDIAESELIRAITEALTVDERVLGVENFEFSWSGDEVFATFLVESIYGNIDIELTAGGDDDGTRETHADST